MSSFYDALIAKQFRTETVQEIMEQLSCEIILKDTSFFIVPSNIDTIFCEFIEDNAQMIKDNIQEWKRIKALNDPENLPKLGGIHLNIAELSTDNELMAGNLGELDDGFELEKITDEKELSTVLSLLQQKELITEEQVDLIRSIEDLEEGQNIPDITFLINIGTDLIEKNDIHSVLIFMVISYISLNTSSNECQNTKIVLSESVKDCPSLDDEVPELENNTETEVSSTKDLSKIEDNLSRSKVIPFESKYPSEETSLDDVPELELHSDTNLLQKEVSSKTDLSDDISELEVHSDTNLLQKEVSSETDLPELKDDVSEIEKGISNMCTGDKVSIFEIQKSSTDPLYGKCKLTGEYNPNCKCRVCKDDSEPVKMIFTNENPPEDKPQIIFETEVPL